VVYVLADMAGELESPVYAILGMTEKLNEIKLPAGYKMNELYLKQPKYEDDFTVKWDGEWQITLEVFRDLGIAFLGVIIIIYILIVGWFQNFKAPIVMMVAIPLSLIGIVLGHWIMGAFFTATSFIGMIALAGIMVRNSVLLIDFVNLRTADGVPLKQAVIEAGAVNNSNFINRWNCGNWCFRNSIRPDFSRPCNFVDGRNYCFYCAYLACGAVGLLFNRTEKS
jgi:multidrug efflux pump subunit AcrB